MKRIVLALLLIATGHLAVAADATKLGFDTYSGYFVSNKFEPNAAESFVFITDQEQFDKVFGVAMVTSDKSHRLAKDAFKSNVILAAIKRGNAVWKFKVEGVTVDDGVVQMRYTATSTKSDSATFASPLIVSIPSGKYTAAEFVENGSPVKKVAVGKRGMWLSDAKVGELPKGWVAAKTGEGPGSVWRVVEDATAPKGAKVLAQTSDKGPDGLFNLCVAENASYKDIELTVAFKAIAGKVDRGGGPLWRYKDANNYYVARMNPLEDNYRVYRVVNGKRTQLGSADVKIPSGEWHTLRVVHKTDRIQCFLDGKLYLDVKDDTFKDAGTIGLWTKADAQTEFAGLEVTQE